RRWVIDLPEERVLCQEATELGIEVAGFGVVEAGFFVPDVAGEGEAVLGGVGVGREAEVAPGVEVVGGDRPAGVVGEVDDRAQAVEGEVAAGLVAAEEGDEAIGAVVVLGDLSARVVVLGQQGGLVVDVLADAVFADLLDTVAVVAILETTDSR